jgi:hypothetical protein
MDALISRQRTHVALERQANHCWQSDFDLSIEKAKSRSLVGSSDLLCQGGQRHANASIKTGRGMTERVPDGPDSAPFCVFPTLHVV